MRSCSIATPVPAVIFGRDTVLTDPTPDKVARLLGLNIDLVVRARVVVVATGVQ